MLQYLVIVDMTKALKQLKAASIKVHNRSEVKMHVKAKDPDDACAVAIDKIYKDFEINGIEIKREEIITKVGEFDSIVRSDIKKE